MKKVMVVFGTRPEAIKMAPVVRALKATPYFEPVVCVTAQHRNLLDQVLELFDLRPDYDLDLMRKDQDLSDITSRVILGMRNVLREAQPDVVLVHGDTSTALAAAVAAFYAKIKVGHVEAGLRTGDIYSPFPEEMNRRLIGAIAALHFAPTAIASGNLRAENIPADQIYETGNTAIDALHWMAAQGCSSPLMEDAARGRIPILMTVHRRENFGDPLQRIFAAVRTFIKRFPQFQIIYPVHPNPNVKQLAHDTFADLDHITLLEPVDYKDLVYLLERCHLVLTDSGGLQEEASAFNKPTLVLRENTERPEAVQAGSALLVGSDTARIVASLETLADKMSTLYQRMSAHNNPFGDGTAGEQIISVLNLHLTGMAEHPHWRYPLWHGQNSSKGMTFVPNELVSLPN